MFDGKAQPRRHYRKLHKELLKLTPEELLRSKQQADLTFFNQGITFTVYGRNEATERIFPHDLLPRIVSAGDWDTIERGLTQRITALNLFLKDIYHEGKIIQDRVIPGSVIYTCRHFRRQMIGVQRAARRLRQRDGDRSRAPAGRPVRGARRQPARAERRVLHALEPQGDEADLPDAVPEVRRAADRAIQPDAALDAARAGARRPSRSDGGAAHARRLQLGLLRALLPRAADGHRARRGARPGRPRQRGLHADDARVEAGARDLPAGGRRLSRSAGVPRRLGAGSAGAVQRLSRRQRHAGQRARHRRGRRQGDLRLRAAHHQVLPRRGSDHRQRRDAADDRRGAPDARRRIGSSSSWSRRWASRAATAC